jgi:ACDE family multidrug resistance protein
MIAPRSPVYITHAPTPKVHHFALLAALEAGVRGLLLSVMPLAIYNAFGDAAIVSRIYFFVGLAALIFGATVPFVSRFVPRRWLYTSAGALYLIGVGLALTNIPILVAGAIMANALAATISSISLSAYVLDYIQRTDLGKNETARLVYSALPWSVGPFLGVWMMDRWWGLPFVVASIFAVLMILTFWRLRLGNGKQITKARGPAPNPYAFLGRFFAQPRLVAGWTFATIRSCGWWVYIVYLPIFCVESGIGKYWGAAAVSLANAILFVAPVMLKVVNRIGVKTSVRFAFAGAAICGAVAWGAADWPWVTYWTMVGMSFFLVALDVSGSLPFLMAVKPSERTEMAAVFASYRDASGILTPAVAWAVLAFAPVSAVFLAGGVGMVIAWVIAGTLHPRLGERKA